MAKAEYRSAVRSRKLINEALVDLLTEKPLDKITVTDVVKRADINRGTFYAHYRDIPDVVDHLIQQTFSAKRDAMIAQTEMPSNIPDGDTDDSGGGSVLLPKNTQFQCIFSYAGAVGFYCPRLFGGTQGPVLSGISGRVSNRHSFLRRWTIQSLP